MTAGTDQQSLVERAKLPLLERIRALDLGDLPLLSEEQGDQYAHLWALTHQ